MRWIIDPSIRTEGAAGIDWCRRYLAGYDTTKVDWLRIDRGRERPLFTHRVPQGLYGRCWYPSGRGKARKGFRISCQVPGPWPFHVYLRLPPVYVTLTRYYGPRPDHVLDEDGSQVFEMGSENGQPYWDVADKPRPKNCPGQGSREATYWYNPDGSVKKVSPKVAWWKQDGYVRVDNLNEAIVWIVGHEAFHFLRKSRQVEGRNVEHEADAAGNAALAAFRKEQGE